eukprot:gene19142-13821_t
MPHDDSEYSGSDRDEPDNDGHRDAPAHPLEGDVGLDTTHRRGVSLTRRWPDETTLLQLLEVYTSRYLQFYQTRYDVTIPTPPSLLPTATATAAEEASSAVSTPSSPAIPPRSPAVVSAATTPSQSIPSLRPPLSLTSPGSGSSSRVGGGGVFPPLSPPSAAIGNASSSSTSTSSFLPARTNRKSRTSGGSLKGSAQTRSVRFMAQPLAALSNLFLHSFPPTDLIARARCLFYYEQSLQCRGKSQREGYDYDSFQYAQALYYYARKVLGKYLLAESVTSGHAKQQHARGMMTGAFKSSSSSSTAAESPQSPRIQLRDEVMRSYMDIQRLLYHQVHFRMTEDVDACLAYTSYYLGMFWYQQQRFEEAVWCFGHVLKRLPTDHWLFESLRTIVADAALYQGNALSQRKRFADAITAYGQSLTARWALRSLSDADVRLLAEQSPAGKAFTASHLVRTPSFFSVSCQHLFVSSDGPSQEMATGTAATGAGQQQQQPVLALLSTPGNNNDNGDFSRHNSNLSAIHSDVAMITSPTKMTPTLTTGGASCSSATATAATTTTGAHHHLFHQHKRQASHSPQQQATLAWMDIAKRYADTYYNFAIACEKENRWEEAMSLLTQALHIRRALITVTQLVPVTWMFLQQQAIAAGSAASPSTMTLATM